MAEEGITIADGGAAAVEVLHADPWLLLVHKPAGLLAVPGRGEDKRDCVLSRLQLRHADALAVHRLDQVTSGVMVFARDPATHRALSLLFAERRIDKAYVAVVEGSLADESGRIDLPLGADWANRPRQVVDPVRGRPSSTDWQVVGRDRSGLRTRLLLHPHSGRTHQLRVHLAAIGHPIVGDVLYGAQPAARVLLHASRLGFAHPHTGERIQATSPVPF